jgi:hypothetical protein
VLEKNVENKMDIYCTITNDKTFGMATEEILLLKNKKKIDVTYK